MTNLTKVNQSQTTAKYLGDTHPHAGQLGPQVTRPRLLTLEVGLLDWRRRLEVRRSGCGIGATSWEQESVLATD